MGIPCWQKPFPFTDTSELLVGTSSSVTMLTLFSSHLDPSPTPNQLDLHHCPPIAKLGSWYPITESLSFSFFMLAMCDTWAQKICFGMRRSQTGHGSSFSFQWSPTASPAAFVSSQAFSHDPWSCLQKVTGMSHHWPRFLWRCASPCHWTLLLLVCPNFLNRFHFEWRC